MELNINTCKTLDVLCESLNTHFQQYDNGERLDIPNLSELPNFSESAPDNNLNIFSWDENRFLVATNCPMAENTIGAHPFIIVNRADYL